MTGRPSWDILDRGIVEGHGKLEKLHEKLAEARDIQRVTGHPSWEIIERIFSADSQAYRRKTESWSAAGADMPTLEDIAQTRGYLQCLDHIMGFRTRIAKMVESTEAEIEKLTNKVDTYKRSAS